MYPSFLNGELSKSQQKASERPRKKKAANLKLKIESDKKKCVMFQCRLDAFREPVLLFTTIIWYYHCIKFITKLLKFIHI